VLILDGTTNSGTELQEYEHSKIKMQVVFFSVKLPKKLTDYYTDSLQQESYTKE
jgi:hypothetical protein